MHTLLLIHAAATLFMTGLIWFVQLVHYPLMSMVARERFIEFEKSHQARTTLIVAPVMLIELSTAMLLVWLEPNAITLAGLFLLILIWLSTIVLQVPAHRRLESGFDAKVHHRLVTTNWLRTVAWSLRSCLVFVTLLPV